MDTEEPNAGKPGDIRVEVESTYVEEQSEPESERFVFAYTVTISNNSASPARLVSRHWIVTDANYKQQEVTGEGVVGKQPYLRPGESFRYTSATMLETPVGSMHGSYQMLDDDGQSFDAPIPAFNLSTPNTIH